LRALTAGRRRFIFVISLMRRIIIVISLMRRSSA
jgi:hypothetical protein